MTPQHIAYYTLILVLYYDWHRDDALAASWQLDSEGHPVAHCEGRCPVRFKNRNAPARKLQSAG